MDNFLEFVNKKQQANIEFCKIRKKGATKIASDAHAKGAGPPQLTYFHFSAKLPEYDHCIKAIQENKPASYFKDQETKYVRQLSSIRNQRKFQEVAGKAECWGEVYLKIID